MSMVNRWTVEIYLHEKDGETHAEARLTTRDTRSLRGLGMARCNPADWDVPEIGEELATARALSDLAHKLFEAAATDIEAVTHEHVALNSR